MKAFLVFLRIIIVGCLWTIVFTEGMRVIMLCNWRFDIFWPGHWEIAHNLLKAGWKVHSPKEWAFVILLITFFPMLITGWWTLSLVSWEDIIVKIIKFPYTLYRKLIKAPLNVITTNNRYGVVKRKSYKQIRPTGVSGLRTPISDYGKSETVEHPVSAAPAPTQPAPSYSTHPSLYKSAPSSAPTAAPVKKTDVAATIDHALFKFDDDDDDDFDLDIDSFEKTDVRNPKPIPQRSAKRYADEDNTGSANRSTTVRRRNADYDDDEDETEYAAPRNARRKNFDGIGDDTRAGYARRNNNRDRNEEREENYSKHSRDNNPERSATNERNKREDGRKNENRDKNQQIEGDNTPHSPVYDALLQKNYEVIRNIKIGATTIDFVGVSETDICLCLVDRESGDWLADEEMFNGEEPLWFSENSHRISPVCLLNKARKVIDEELNNQGFEQKLSAFVVIQMANIINADDMFEIWDDMDIKVTRINRGMPKEIRLFSKTLTEAENPASARDIEKIGKLLRSLK